MSISERKSPLRRSHFITDFEEPVAVRTSEFFIGKPGVPIAWRIFLNHVDSYHGRYLVDALSEQNYVKPQEDASRQSEDKQDDEETEEKEDNEEENASVEDEDVKKYQIIGTLWDLRKQCPDDVAMIIKEPCDREVLLNELMKCGVIIYDITQDPCQIDEAHWALKAIQNELEKMAESRPKEFKRSPEVRYFILLSTVMTWARTKPLSPEDPDLPFTEADYRKRRPHHCFQDHCQLEKEVLAVRKNANLSAKLKTLVIGCGVTYGEDEGPLHYLFKMAWKNARSLPIIGDGGNRVPLLHVRDLVATVSAVVGSWPKLRYILAVEEQLVSQRTIVKKISRALSTGNVMRISGEEAMALPEMTGWTRDMLTVDLNMEPVFLVDAIQWHFGTPFRENVARVVEEFRRARNLRPRKVIVLGPPASGKTRVARYLAEHYGLHYIHVESLIADTVRKLSNEIDAAVRARSRESAELDESAGSEDDEDDEEEEEPPSVEELKEELAELRKSLEKNGGRLDDEALNKLVASRMSSKECQNQGYVLDGYPKTLEQAKGLFGDGDDFAEENESDQEDEALTATATSAIMPELVVALEASDEFLRERVTNQPERVIQNTHYTEEHMMRRLAEYRERNTEDNTPLRFFDEIEIHPLVIPIESDVCPDMFPTIASCLEKLGKPMNYGLTPEEAADAEARAAEKARATEEAERLRKEGEFAESKRRREEKMMEWTNLMESLREEEEERLCILGEPLRHYLARYIFPTLTQALIEVAKLRPDDPIDYLAEYLFKENPEGKMFEPDHTRAMTIILDKIEEFGTDIVMPEDLDDTVLAFWENARRSKPAEVTVDETVASNCGHRPDESPSTAFESSGTVDCLGCCVSDCDGP